MNKLKSKQLCSWLLDILLLVGAAACGGNGLTWNCFGLSMRLI